MLGYDPKAVEPLWYGRWEACGAFKARRQHGKEAYAIMIPPPNVTGILTMGHVLNTTLQDVLVRRARQRGRAVLWLPGTDHAGLATQVRVEKELAREGLTRQDLGREAFLKKTVAWRDAHGGIILAQLKRLGVSCDWDRNVHTLDPGYSAGVYTAFVRLYERGRIYRGLRMTHWCPVSRTALSDEEVNMKLQKRSLYTVRYALVEADAAKGFNELLVATTRPETIMADVALAVHPQDERYAHLVGKFVWRPFNREKIPIIADVRVEKDFGTGVLKITPAHDPLDFEIGQAHALPIIDVLNADGTLNALAGKDFEGLDRFDARKKAETLLRAAGLLAKQEAYESPVGFSERADVPIEPRLTRQWFLRYPRVEEAKKVVKEGLIRFHPERWVKNYLHWMDGIHDWCISRQVWWGHRIPVWYAKGEDKEDACNWHVSVEGPKDPENWEQDEDTLDTWASAWLWPFATLGWPNPTPEQAEAMAYWYPTSDLVTGPDILFFWVSRMIMAGLELMGEPKEVLTDEDLQKRIPFKNVYFTGIIRDDEGRKMSKSLGNSPDPIDLIDKYGADGLRFGVISIAPQGQDVFFNEERVAQGQYFCNKLWNACRFREHAGPLSDNTLEALLSRLNSVAWQDDDHALIARLIQTLDVVEGAYQSYHFNALTQQLYAFFWNDFCDWYLEASKVRAKTQAHVLAVQDLCLRNVLLLLHPIIPFITQELWSRMGYGTQLCQDVAVPSSKELTQQLEAQGVRIDFSALERVKAMQDLVAQLRTLKAEYHVQAKRNIAFFYQASASQALVLEGYKAPLCFLIGAGSLEPVAVLPLAAPTTLTSLGTFAMDLSSAIDLEAQRLRLTQELEQLNKHIESTQARMDNPSFREKAPAAVLEGAQKQLKALQEKRLQLKSLL